MSEEVQEKNKEAAFKVSRVVRLCLPFLSMVNYFEYFRWVKDHLQTEKCLEYKQTARFGQVFTKSYNETAATVCFFSPQALAWSSRRTEKPIQLSRWTMLSFFFVYFQDRPTGTKATKKKIVTAIMNFSCKVLLKGKERRQYTDCGIVPYSVT